MVGLGSNLRHHILWSNQIKIFNLQSKTDRKTEYSTERSTKFITSPNCVSKLSGNGKWRIKQHILKSIISQGHQSNFGCSQLPQKVVHCSSFPIIGRKFFYQSSVRKSLTFPHVFDKNRPIFKLNILYRPYLILWSKTEYSRLYTEKSTKFTTSP